MAKAKKQEALSVSRLINEVLVAQLSIPFRQIVNDTSFAKYTGSKRPDILISEFEYTQSMIMRIFFIRKKIHLI